MAIDVAKVGSRKSAFSDAFGFVPSVSFAAFRPAFRGFPERLENGFGSEQLFTCQAVSCSLRVAVSCSLDK